jgi:hypothetical protein
MTGPGLPDGPRVTDAEQLYAAYRAAVRRERSASGQLTRAGQSGAGTKITAAEARLTARQAETGAARAAFEAARAGPHPAGPAPEAGS